LAALCWGLGLLFVMPAEVGESLLGSVWPAASLLIVPATLSVMNAGLSSGASTGLRALGAARLGLRAQLIASLAYAGGGVAGALLGGAVGSSWGVAGATLFGAVLWWTHLRIGLRAHRDRAATDGLVTTARAVPEASMPIDDSDFTDTAEIRTSSIRR
jgi:hypothetical protein